MRKRTISWMMRTTVFVVTVATTIVQLVPAEAAMQPVKPMKMKPVSELPAGLTQRLTPAQWKQVDAQRAKAEANALANRPEVRLLTNKEMRQLHGRGLTSLRSKYFAGTLPWHRSLRDANLCTGNLFKSFTDIQVQGGKGAGLALQRTYNSDESRIGPFGVGWTHAYDIRNVDENPTSNGYDTTLNYSDRQDFFGAEHKYHRDADGLYTPPAYLYDEHDSNYNASLLNVRWPEQCAGRSGSERECNGKPEVRCVWIGEEQHRNKYEQAQVRWSIGSSQ